MNKSLFLGMFAAASMLFATSCSNDELEVVQSDEKTQVSFKLGLEDVIGSRAISDGETADKLVYAVFDNAGNRISTIDQVSKETSFPTTVSLTLAKGQSYQVAFWAQNKACNAYTVADDMNVTVDYTGVNNDETRDAFFKTVSFTVTGSTSIDVELKRPFAQINVGVYESDWKSAVASGVEIEKSSVVIKNAATSMNLLTGVVDGSTDVTYELGIIPEKLDPSESLKVDTDGDGTKEEYKWLSMSYILVSDDSTTDEDNDGTLGDAKATLESLQYTFSPKSGNPIVFKEGLNSIPVQRNWRTNILGKILTGDIQFNITIDPVYEGENNNEQDWGKGYIFEDNTFIIYNADGFKEVASLIDEYEGFVGITIKLGADIDLFKGYMPDGDPITTAPIGDKSEYAFMGTFDGQGYSIKNLYQNGYFLQYWYGKYGSIGLFRKLENATVKNLVVEDSEVFIEGGDVSFIAGSATGTCVFENIEIKNSTIATFNNGCGGIIGWSGSGNYTFKNIKLDANTTIGGFQQSFDASVGGIVGQAEPGATYNFENVEINCRLEVYNDVTASYQYYLYRMCGMVIGRCEETITINGASYPDLSKYNMTFNNVVVNYGDWMNYHYCEGPWGTKGKGARIEAGYRYDGLDLNAADHSDNCKRHNLYIPFDQLIGGDQYGVRGLREVAGVKVNYPGSYRREVSSAAALTEALSKGVSVILDTDIDYGTTQLAITGENQVVDLGGHTLTTEMTYGGISLKNGSSIKNGTIVHSSTVAAIKAFNVGEIENVTIRTTCQTADKTVTAIAVQQGGYVGSIKNVTIEGVSQGIEVGYQATVDVIDNAQVNMSTNGTANGIGLVINGGKVGLAKNSTFKGDVYGITMHLKGTAAVGLELEKCNVEGATAWIYAYDEKGISNTSGSLTLTYDAATTLVGPFVWDFEEECQSVVTLNAPK